MCEKVWVRARTESQITYAEAHLVALPQGAVFGGPDSCPWL